MDFEELYRATYPRVLAYARSMASREDALAELQRVFELIEDEYREQGKDLPADTTEIVHA